MIGKLIDRLDSFFGRLHFRYLGLGALLAWVYCTWFANGIFNVGETRLAILSLWASLLASAIALFSMAFRPNKRTPLSERTVSAAGFVMAACTLSLRLVVQVPCALVVLSVIGGVASSALWVAWGELFCQTHPENAERSIPASLVVFVGCALAVHFLPGFLSGVITSCLPVAASLMLLLCKKSEASEFTFAQPIKPFSQVFLLLISLAACSMVCSIATGFVSVSIYPGASYFAPDEIILAYIAGASIACMLAVVAIAHTSKMDFSFLYQWAIPLIVFALAARVLGGMVFNTAALVLACSAAFYVEVLFYAIFSRITARGLCLPSETFGIFRAVVQLGFLVGSFFGARLVDAVVDVTGPCLLLICACVVMLPLFINLQKRLGEVDSDAAIEGGIGGNARAKTAASSMEDEEGERALAMGQLSMDDVTADLAREYKLSPREAEVFGFLAKGRSVPYMRDALVISKSTIETHIKHIYAKCNVHSKQELLDLVEARQRMRE